MDKEKAKQILLDNRNAENSSFIYYIHERDCFDRKAFWEYYDSIAALVTAEKTPELTRLITDTYQGILKYFIWHFSPKDSYRMKDFPSNYSEYIERLDYVLTAYHLGKADMVSEDREKSFELQRE